MILAVFLIALFRGQGEADARALAFTALIFGNLGLILINRSWSQTALQMLRFPNPAFWWILGGTLVFLGLVLYIPFFQNLFHFSRLHTNDLLLCLASGMAGVFWFEGLKIINSRKSNGPGRGRA